MAKYGTDGKKNIAKSFKELGQVMFNKFLDMGLEEKKNYLKDCGIIWGAEYLGVYHRKTQTVTIETLNNPFNNMPIEGIILGKPLFEDGARLIVRLKTGRTKGKPSTPNNIFGFEYVGRVNNKRYTDLSAAAAVKTLQEENKKYKNKIENLEYKESVLEERLADYEAKNELLLEDVREQHKRNKQLIQQLEKEREKVEGASYAIQVKNEALFRQLEETKCIADIIIKRKIDALLHVTQLNNLESILRSGIVPVSRLGREGNRNDFSRLDNKHNCSSLSVGRINGFYFRDILRRSDGRPTFVCIYVSPSILLDDNTKYYCKHNAATKSIREQTGRGQLTSAEDFENMFLETVNYIRSDGPMSHMRNNNYHDNWPTSEQAEILYEGVIQPDSILAIGFPTTKSLNDSSALLKKYGIKGVIDNTIDF